MNHFFKYNTAAGSAVRFAYLGLSSDLAASAGPTIMTKAAMARPVCVTAKMSA
jgi:hypothetical protein